MLRTCLKIVTAALLVGALFAGTSARAESPFVGNWKILDVSSGHEAALVLIQIEEKDGKADATVLASPLLGKDVTVSNVKTAADSLEFDVKFGNGTFHAKGHTAKDKTVYGVIRFNNQLILAQFQKTDDKELSREDAQKMTSEGEKLQAARQNEDAKEKQATLKELVEKHADTPAGYLAAQDLLESYVKAGAKEEELQTTAKKFLESSAKFGPEIERNTLLVSARTLALSEKVPPLALEFAQKAEKSLTKDDSPETTVKVFKLLATVLRRSGKVEETKALEERINKIEEPLDEAFEKNAVPFKSEAFKGRKGDSKRVAVVELFTGAYCPPCVAADIAFDAVLETYKPKDVILLQYHTHIPAPDRLTNSDTLARQKFYEKAIRGVPSAFLNGKATKPLGGPKAGGERSYKSLTGEIDEALEKDATAALKVNVDRKGDKIVIGAEVTDLKDPGEKVKLRFVLIQEVTRYPGGNGQRLHHHVVRALPGGADGFSLKEAKSTQNATINLVDLKKELGDYLIEYSRTKQMFRDDDYPLHFKGLKVIALIQDDDTKEILQAVEVEVPETK